MKLITERLKNVCRVTQLVSGRTKVGTLAVHALRHMPAHPLLPVFQPTTHTRFKAPGRQFFLVWFGFCLLSVLFTAVFPVPRAKPGSQWELSKYLLSE